ncbi:hypothetical protein FACS1894145_4540 [Bacteroidia bacterium]|nr:hypothetical protein FACS1894145_4540 [Bacteroidia bacterium]
MKRIKFGLIICGVLLLGRANAQDAQIDAGTIGNSQSVCYNITPTKIVFTTLPSGGGEDATYNYQWQSSTDNSEFNDIDGETGDSYQPEFIQGIRYYQVVVTCNGESGVSNAVTVTGWDDISAATISNNNQTICYNTAPSAISIQTAANGGNDLFSNQWQILDGTNWKDIAGETGNAYQPSNLTTTTQYRLKSVSDYGCGTVYSNTIKIMVYPQITTPKIKGDITVCKNQWDVSYTIETNDANDAQITYHWEIDGGKTINSNNDSTNISVHWNKDVVKGKMKLVQKTKQDGCSCASDTATLEITARKEIAPDTTIIKKKENSDILICADANPTAHYQWGYINGKDTIPLYDNYGDRYQYFKIYDGINSDYTYFVDIYYEDTGCEDCKTRSYYYPKQETSQPVPSNQKIAIFPNPAKEHFSLLLGAEFTGNMVASLKNLSGKTMLTKHITDYKNNEVVSFDLNLPKGIYLLVVQTSEEVLTSKILIK